MALVTLDQAKQALRISAGDTSVDAIVQQYVDGITRVIEDYKREVIDPRTVTEDIEASGRRFRLWSTPVRALTSVTAVRGGYSWDVTQMRVTPGSGLVRVLDGPPVCGLVTVTYDAGYDEPPAHYVQGALVTLQHVWETRRGVGTVRPGVIGTEETYDPRYSYSIPRKALEWLGAPTPVVG